MSELLNAYFKFHHVGIVVPCIENAVENHLKLFGKNENVFFETVSSQQVRIALIGEWPGAYLEYIEPTSTSSPVYTFSQKGGGLHHICFYVSDLASAKQMIKPFYRRISSSALGLMGKPMEYYFAKSPVLGMDLIELLEIKTL